MKGYTIILFLSLNIYNVFSQIDMNHTNIDYYFNLLENKEYNEAIDLIDNIIINDEFTQFELDTLLYFKGYALYLKNEYYNSIIELNKSIEINPNNLDAHFTRANCYKELEKNDLALEEYTYILAKDSLHAGSYLNRGNLKLELGDTLGGIIDINKSLSIRPIEINATELSENYLMSGYEKIQNGNYIEAIQDLNKSIELFPSCEGYFLRGNAKGHLDDFRGAISDFSYAIEINQVHEDSYFFRALAFEEIDKYSEAIADYSQVIEINKYNNEAYFRRGICFYNSGEIDKGCLDFSKAGELGYTDAYKYISEYCK